MKSNKSLIGTGKKSGASPRSSVNRNNGAMSAMHAGITVKGKNLETVNSSQRNSSSRPPNLIIVKEDRNQSSRDRTPVDLKINLRNN
jgi:hypothetical protein